MWNKIHDVETIKLLKDIKVTKVTNYASNLLQKFNFKSIFKVFERFLTNKKVSNYKEYLTRLYTLLIFLLFFQVNIFYIT